MMQIYKGKFKSNGNCGYVLKPEIMREGILNLGHIFNPFCAAVYIGNYIMLSRFYFK